MGIPGRRGFALLPGKLRAKIKPTPLGDNVPRTIPPQRTGFRAGGPTFGTEIEHSPGRVCAACYNPLPLTQCSPGGTGSDWKGSPPATPFWTRPPALVESKRLKSLSTLGSNLAGGLRSHGGPQRLQAAARAGVFSSRRLIVRSMCPWAS